MYVYSDWLRWVVLFGFMLFGASVQSQYILFVIVESQAKKYFNMNTLQINTLPLLFPLLHFFLGIPMCYFANVFGLKQGLLFGMALNIIGALLRVISTIWSPQFIFLLFSNIVVSIANNFYIGFAPLISSVWFPVNERVTSTAMATLSGYLGLALIAYISPYILTHYSCSLDSFNKKNKNLTLFNLSDNISHTQLKYEDCTTGFIVLTGLELVLSILPFFIFIFIFIPNKPKQSEDQLIPETKSNSLTAELMQLAKNTNFLKVLFLFFCTNGTTSALSAVITNILNLFGINEHDSSIIFVLGLVSGAIMCIIIGKLTDRFHSYKKLWIAQMCLIFLFFLLLIFIQNKWVVSVFIAIIMSLVASMFPLVVEFSVELTYPTLESVIGTLVSNAGDLGQSIFILVITKILQGHDHKHNIMIILLLYTGIHLVVGLLILFFVQEDLKRIKINS